MVVSALLAAAVLPMTLTLVPLEIYRPRGHDANSRIVPTLTLHISV
jgi:hypothetical protein